MSIDLILWAQNKANLATFARNRGLQVQDSEGNWQDAPGFTYTFWAGSGQFLTAQRTFKASRGVDIIDPVDREFGFSVKPAWMAAGVTAEKDGDVIGTYDRAQGPYSVFTATGALPSVGEVLDAYTPNEYLSGVVAIIRLYGQRAVDDAEEDTGQTGESWDRSKVAQAIRNNGTPISVAGGAINGYEWDGVRIFRYQDVDAWLSAQGLPGHEWLGGNTY